MEPRYLTKISFNNKCLVSSEFNETSKNTVDVGKSTDVKKQEHDIKNYRKRVNVSDTGNSDENLK